MTPQEIINRLRSDIERVKSQNGYGKEYVAIYKIGNVLSAFGKDAEALGKVGAKINVCGRAIIRDYDENKYWRLLEKQGRYVMVIEKI